MDDLTMRFPSYLPWFKLASIYRFSDADFLINVKSELIFTQHIVYVGGRFLHRQGLVTLSVDRFPSLQKTLIFSHAILCKLRFSSILEPYGINVGCDSLGKVSHASTFELSEA
jgi:hypothetical protein